MRLYITKNHKKIRLYVLGIFVLLIVGDIILVAVDELPTISAVYKKHEGRFLFGSFLFGALIAKIYFNRPVRNRKEEVIGILILVLIIATYSIIGGTFVNEPPLQLQLLLMVTGGLCGYWLWPQYKAKEFFTVTESN